jgi:uncharacterized protein
MKMTLQTGPGVNLIRSFAPGELRVGDDVIRTSCLLAADTIVTDWPPQRLADLTLAHLDRVTALQPEIVIIGSGTKQRFPERALLTALLSKRIGVEVMDTAAASRTFNVLVAEDRSVVAALFLAD